MKITIESTDKIVYLNGIPARIWEGETASGICVHCFITRIAVRKYEPRVEEFTADWKKPSPRVRKSLLSLHV